ncbi:MAG: hypothetical protein J07HQW1_00241 [Haloquadratum walsbyi J07HQW1]|uniref:Uncharacterized protein n=1 Tax=Haloquadratum walsbyi J07HQW1 TaxID=1238424 RepID=U1N1K8_9EURY|nr:MAG: hypothetical protein J07HQW1_00241 [Haloquadratum walsbyi J07HQW1]
MPDSLTDSLDEIILTVPPSTMPSSVQIETNAFDDPVNRLSFSSTGMFVDTVFSRLEIAR